MGEQEYYVQINRSLWNNLNPLQLGGIGIDLCSSEYVYWQYFIAEYEPESSYAKVNKNSFTKTELAKIMNGALYRKPFLGETGIQPEWINPLIELVPVEEGE